MKKVYETAVKVWLHVNARGLKEASKKIESCLEVIEGLSFVDAVESQYHIEEVEGW